MMWRAPAGIRRYGPRIGVRKPAPVRKPSPVKTSSTAKAATPRPTRIAHYDASRVIDVNKIKYVDDIALAQQKQFSEERGDVVADPGKSTGRTIGPSTPVINQSAIVETSQKPVDGKKLIGLAIAGYLLLKGF